MPIWARCPLRIVATPNERFDPRDHEARRGKLCVSPVVAMGSIHVPMWARRRHIGSRRAAEIRSTRLGATQPVSSRRSRRRSTRPCERDFRPIGFPVSGRRFDLPAYEDAASRCSRRSRSTRPCGRDLRRIGFPASRRRLRSYVQPRGARGRFAPRTNVGRVRVPPRRDTASRPGESVPRANVGATSDGLGSHRRRRRFRFTCL
jgi:hypothetical protein